MATKEFREFFLRAAQVNSGTKPDKELGFPVQYQVVDCDGNPITVFNRFLKNHVPSEAVFKKLFESIAFKLNPEDTATTSNVGQGLVRIAIGTNVIGRIDAEDNITTVIVPSTLPKVSAVSGCTVTPVIRRVSDNVIVGSITPGDRGLYYVEYQITVPAIIDNVKLTNHKDIDTTSIDESSLTADGLGTTLFSQQIAGNTLVTNGDHVHIELTLDKSTAGGGTAIPTLMLKFGNTFTHSFGSIGGAGLDPALGELSYHAHIKANIYRTSATTAKIVGTLHYYTRPNATYGESRHSIPAISDISDVYFTYDLVADCDWTLVNYLNLYFDCATTDVNEQPACLINLFTKTILD